MSKQLNIVWASDESRVTKSLDNVSGGASKAGAGFAKFGAVAAAGLAVGGAALFSFGKSSLEAYKEAAVGAAQTEAVIKSTGGAAKVTAKDVDELTASLMKKAAIDDDVIRTGTNMLLTFTNLQNGVGKGNDIFDQANSTLVDMSVAMGTDMKSTAIQLGKALQDPVKGITALTRVGVTFTDQQKEQIKAMVEAGDTAGAQKVILAELNKEFGGSAEAQAKAKGGIERLKLAWGEFQETAGGKLATVLNVVADVLLDRIFPAFAQVGGVISGVVGWFQQFGIAGEAGVAGASVVGEKIKAVFAGLKSWWDGIWPQLSEAVGHVINFLKMLWQVWGSDVLTILQGAWQAISGVVMGAIQVVRGIIQTVLAIINGDWGRAWDGIKMILGGVWSAIQGIVGGAVKILQGVIGGWLSAIGALFSGAWRMIQSGVSAAFGFVVDRITGAVNTARSNVSAAINAIKGAFQSLMDKVRAVVNFINSNFEKLAFWRHSPSLMEQMAAQTVEGVNRKWDLLKVPAMFNPNDPAYMATWAATDPGGYNYAASGEIYEDDPRLQWNNGQASWKQPPPAPSGGPTTIEIRLDRRVIAEIVDQAFKDKLRDNPRLIFQTT